jgi:hypothetical protein
MSVASFGYLQHVKRLFDAPPSTRFVRGGVTFIVDRSVSSSPGYEWIDDHTVRIHPDAVAEMESNLATESDFE